MRDANNPILLSDFPDPDVIRVEDTYYMVSTTMHMMPGGVILRSYNLVDWEIASYVFDRLDSTPAQRLADHTIYGRGMWAASLRYHAGQFYVCFVANDTQKTYLYTAKNIAGPWKKQIIEGFYHDCSILFDDDSKVYIVYGNRQIHLSELKADLTGKKIDGLDKVILEDGPEYKLGLEGSHFYKINGKYYIFCIHWSAKTEGRRTEACYVSDKIEGPYQGCDVLNDDMGFRNCGVAQGGIVDTPDGDWYAMLFQDHGAMGRIPVLVPVTWEKDFPVFGVNGVIPQKFSVKDNRPEYEYHPLVESDDFSYLADEQGKVVLKSAWQWNHEPDEHGWTVLERPGYLRLRTVNLCNNVVSTVNTLSQRTMGCYGEATVILDGKGMLPGDYAGISAFLGTYCFLALRRTDKGFEVVQMKRSVPTTQEEQWMGGEDSKPGVLCAVISSDSFVTFKIRYEFGDEEDGVLCYYLENGCWKQIGERIQLYFTLDHFMGCRIALSYFATEEIGGIADFDSYTITYREE